VAGQIAILHVNISTRICELKCSAQRRSVAVISSDYRQYFKIVIEINFVKKCCVSVKNLALKAKCCKLTARRNNPFNINYSQKLNHISGRKVFAQAKI
jgi:hypothetical protein